MLQRLFDLLKDVLRTLFAENLPFTIVCGLGFVAICTLLPRPRRTRVILGAVAGVAAIVLSFFLILRLPGGGTLEDKIEQALFYLFAAGALAAGGLLVTQKNPARAALSFALVILCTCGLFLLQAAPFLMAATIIVYAGAIIVTFLFVLMLAQQQGQSDADARSREPFLAALTGFLLLAALLYVLKVNFRPEIDQWTDRAEAHLRQVKTYRQWADERRPQPNVDQVAILVADLKKFTDGFENWWARPRAGKEAAEPRGGRLLTNALKNLKGELDFPPDNSPKHLKAIEDRLADVLQAAVAVRNDPILAGGSRPGHWEIAKKDNPENPDESPRIIWVTNAGALSDASGPRSSRPPDEIRRDSRGRPVLPAENTRYLGQSLFSDYLLGVELAGMLLLVATIGAIAIASRRPHTPGAAPVTGEGKNGRTP